MVRGVQGVKIVAEISLQHCGCLGTALAFVDACAAAGVDAVKAQAHNGDPCNRFRPGTHFPQDESRQAYYQRTMFTPAGWQALYNRAKLRGIEFGCSVWSADTVGWLHPFVDFWKVPSGEVGNRPLLEAMAKTGKPVVLSSGMSTVDEVRQAEAILNSALAQQPIIVLQCTSQYPCPPEKIGIEYIETERSDWVPGHFIFDGLSDHSGTIWPGIVAAWLGADMLEVHCCWSKQQWGPDVTASLTIDELAQLVQGVRFVEKMRANPVDKDALAASPEIREMRRVFVNG